MVHSDDGNNNYVLHHTMNNSTNGNTDLPYNVISPGVYALTAVLSFTAVASVVGNVLVQIAFWRTVALKCSSPATLVMVLAFVDLCMAVFIIPFVIITALNDGWSLDGHLCVASGFMNTLLTAVQFGVLFSISVNRFTAVWRPHRYQLKWTIQVTYAMIAIVVGHSLIWSVLPFLGWGGYDFAQGTLYCNIHWSEHKGHSTSLFVCCYIVPAFIAAVLYIVVYVKIRDMRNETQRRTSSQRESQHHLENGRVHYESNSDVRVKSATLTGSTFSINMKGAKFYGSNHSVHANKKAHRFRTRESRVTKSLLIVAAAFAIFWLPRGLVNSWAVVSGRDSVPQSLEYLTTAFIFMNSFVNPVIYGLFHYEYNKAFRRILKCKTMPR